MHCEECGTRIWQAGHIAPAGAYIRLDDKAHQRVVLAVAGPLPATFDGHIALYSAAGITCACMRRAGCQPGAQDAVASAAPDAIQA